MSGERAERRCGGIGGACGRLFPVDGEDEEGTLAARDPPRAWRPQDRLQTADIALRLLRSGELHRKTGSIVK